MPKIIIVEKNGNLQTMNIKSFVESDLYKKAGFKTPNNFDCHTIWNVELFIFSSERSVDEKEFAEAELMKLNSSENNIIGFNKFNEGVSETKDGSIEKDCNEIDDSSKKFIKKRFSIELYAKNTGRANQENKYEFPPPVDNMLFFGSCVLINRNLEDSTKINDIEVNEWKMIYNKLYGGFEDLTVADSGDEDEEAEIREEMKAIKNNKLTKTGYLNDGFVVEDNDEEDLSDSDDSSIEEHNDTSIGFSRKVVPVNSLNIPSQGTTKTFSFTMRSDEKINTQKCSKDIDKSNTKIIGKKCKKNDLSKTNSTEFCSEKNIKTPETSISDSTVISSVSVKTSSDKKITNEKTNNRSSKPSKRSNKQKKTTLEVDVTVENGEIFEVKRRINTDDIGCENNLYLNCENELIEEDYV
jgi:hypothetical protein